MRKIIFVFALILHVRAVAQNVGIKTTTPQATLDINGDIIIRPANLVVANGTIAALNVNTTKFSYYRISGPTADFVIAGITAGIDGRLITLFNRSGFTMQLNNEDAAAVAANRVITGTTADITVPDKVVVTLQYDAVEQRWVVKSSSKGGSGNGNGWDISGADIYNNNTGGVGIGNTLPAAKLHITGTDDISQLIIDAYSGQTTPLMILRDAAGADLLQVRADNPFNTFYGMNAGSSNDATTGLFNTFIGSNSGVFNASGVYNTAIGRASFYQNTTGNYNTALGFHSLFSNIDGYANTAAGSEALNFNTNGDNNTAFGTQALYRNVFSDNTAFGANSLRDNTTGHSNSALGSSSLLFNIDGNNNTAIGRYCLTNNLHGSQNTAVGKNALFLNSNLHNNTAVGYSALFSQDFTGQTSSDNTAIGYEALFSNNPTTASNGYSNTAVGSGALHSNTIGSLNTAIGVHAAYTNTTGNHNVAAGRSALYYNVTGDDNIAIGDDSGVTPPGNIINTVSIGNYNYLNGASNQAFLGNLNTIWNGGKVTWSTFSDARIKNTIQQDVKGLEFIMRLKPVTYFTSIKTIMDITGNKDDRPDYPGKYDGDKIKHSGFLAQEVAQAAKESGYDFSGITHVPKTDKELYTLSYEQFVVPLVKAMQEQQAMIEELKKTIEELKKKTN